MVFVALQKYVCVRANSKRMLPQASDNSTDIVDSLRRTVEVPYLGSVLTMQVSSFQEEVQVRAHAWAKSHAVSAGILPRWPWEEFMMLIDKPCKFEKSIVKDSKQAHGWPKGGGSECKF